MLLFYICIDVLLSKTTYIAFEVYSSVRPVESNPWPSVNAAVLSHLPQLSSAPYSLFLWLAAELKRRVSVQQSGAPLPISSLASDVHKDVLVPNVACRSPAWRNTHTEYSESQLAVTNTFSFPKQWLCMHSSSSFEKVLPFLPPLMSKWRVKFDRWTYTSRYTCVWVCVMFPHRLCYGMVLYSTCFFWISFVIIYSPSNLCDCVQKTDILKNEQQWHS